MLRLAHVVDSLPSYRARWVLTPTPDPIRYDPDYEDSKLVPLIPEHYHICVLKAKKPWQRPWCKRPAAPFTRQPRLVASCTSPTRQQLMGSCLQAHTMPLLLRYATLWWQTPNHKVRYLKNGVWYEPNGIEGEAMMNLGLGIEAFGGWCL